MMTKEARDSKGQFWTQHWRECEAAGEGMAVYARRHDLSADEGYRWKRILQRGTAADPSAASASAPRFARVRIATIRHAEASVPLKLVLLLVNGRRAELMMDDARQLPRVLALLEQPG
jgi:hypothetical protein